MLGFVFKEELVFNYNWNFRAQKNKRQLKQQNGASIYWLSV